MYGNKPVLQLVLRSFRSMVRSVQVSYFLSLTRSFRSFGIKLDVKRAFLAYGLNNEVYTENRSTGLKTRLSAILLGGE